MSCRSRHEVGWGRMNRDNIVVVQVVNGLTVLNYHTLPVGETAAT